MKRKLLPAILASFLLVCTLTLCGCSALRDLSASTGVCLVAENGQCLLICDASPIALSNRSRDPDLFAGLQSGDTIRVTHDGIQETYPARTGAYAVQKLASGSIEDIPVAVLDSLMDMGWTFKGIARAEEPVFSTAVAWANYGDENLLWSRAANRDMAGDAAHRPILRFDSADALAAFKAEIADTFDTQHDYDEIPSFNTVTAEMDDAFFTSRSLLLVYVWSGSCTWRYGVNQVSVENGCLTVHVQRTDSFEVGDCAMAGWFLTVSLPKEQLSGITAYDAVFSNRTA